jgi:hypothetical protein
VADRVQKVSYCYMKVPNRAGAGERILSQLREGGVDLLVFSGFPIRGGNAQLDFAPQDMAAFRKVVRKHGWRVSAVKRAFLVTGTDRLGATHRHIRKLADAKINITAVDAVAAGKGRYGVILWVKPAVYGRAARALGAVSN